MKEENNELENFYKKAANDFPLKKGEGNWQFIEDSLNEEEDNKKPFFWLFTRSAIFSLFVLLLTTFLAVYTLTPKTNKLNNSSDRSVVDTEKTYTEPITEKRVDRKKLEEDITEVVYQKIIDSLQKQSYKNYNKVVEKQKKDRIWTLTTTKPFNTNSVKAESQGAALLNKISSAVSKALDDEKFVADNLNQAPKNNTTLLKNDNEVLKNNVAIIKRDNPVDTVVSVDKPKVKNDSKIKSKFYLGVLASAEVNRLGPNAEPESDDPFDAGLSIIAGYHLGKKISIETGIAFKKKTYYGFNDNFNTSILPLKGSMIGVESENKLIEIPLSINYSLLQKNKHKLFAGVGLSSYIINEEYYEYEENVNGTVHQEHIVFDNASSNFFASCNFSLGYEYAIKNKIGIRVQPYYSLPVSGLGKGRVPVSAKGINLGCIYHF